MQSTDQFIACPNPDCSSFSFFADEVDGDDYNEVVCRQPFECPSCNFQWRTKAQLDAQTPILSIANLQRWDWRKFNLFGYLYKLCFSEVCPSCHINIIRTEGCKFMECSKCKYQFCWYCLDEFYTTYHYEYTNCPFRYCFLHSIEVACGILIFTKAVLVFETVHMIWMFFVSKVCTQVAIQIEILFVKKGLKRLLSAKNAQQQHLNSIRGRIHIPAQVR